MIHLSGQFIDLTAEFLRKIMLPGSCLGRKRGGNFDLMDSFLAEKSGVFQDFWGLRMPVDS